MSTDRRRLRDSIEEIVAHIGIFAGAGPSIGAIVFFLISLFLIFASESNAPNPLPNLLPEYGGIGYMFSRIAYALFVLVLAIPFSYVLESLAAAFTGLVVGISSIWIRKIKWLFLLAAIVGGVSSVVNFFAILVISEMDTISKMSFDQMIEGAVKNLWIHTILLAVTGAASAVICTYLTKSFRQNEQPPSSEAEPHPETSA